MKVKDLIDKLISLDQEKEVFVYIEGDRFNIHSVDETLEDCIDLEIRS